MNLKYTDSSEMAEARRKELQISRPHAAELGRTAVEISRAGQYLRMDGTRYDLSQQIHTALETRRSIPPDAELPTAQTKAAEEIQIEVTNETTLASARRMVDRGLRPLALNFANGVSPGGGFLHGALAQEEVICRSSALFLTLDGDPMYAHHKSRPQPDSTNWAILSPSVPIFRHDDGTALDVPWMLDFITCAAPYAPRVGQAISADLLKHRIWRVLEIARAYQYSALVLGAWGCGAFKNDPHRTASDFREALESTFFGAFSEISFAICDWSETRRFLGPFREVFSQNG